MNLTVSADDVLAERRSTLFCRSAVGGVDPDAAFPERAGVVNDRDERERGIQQGRSEPGQPVERLLRPRVQQPGTPHRRQPGRIENPRG
jgi:hypothetical protein